MAWIVHESSPQMAAEISADLDALSEPSDILAEPGCDARRLGASGAQMTFHDSEQSTGIVQPLWIVSSTAESPLSV